MMDTRFICELTTEEQKEIRTKLEKCQEFIPELDIEVAMSSRLSDIADTLYVIA